VLELPRAEFAVSWEELDLLKTIGEQAASYLAEELALRALVEANRLEEFNRWSAFLVHDLKGVVNQMSLVVANAESHAHDHAFQRDVVATVANSVQRMHFMLEQLNARRRQQAAADTEVDIAALLREVGRRWRRSIPSIVSPDAAPSLLVKAGEGALVSVLDHLIQNAFDAAGTRGQITLDLRRQGTDCVLEVKDDGPGMEPAFVQGSLFKPLASNKANGFGLGAFQVRHLVRGMGGKLEVDSTPGKGTTMVVRLPLFESGTMIRQRSRELL
jgi:putative PEP-CTERM system histidine kinase